MVSAFTYPSQRNDFSVGIPLIWNFFGYTQHTPTDKIEVPFFSLLKANHEWILYFILMFSDLEVIDYVYVLLIVAFKILNKIFLKCIIEVVQILSVQLDQ